MSFFHDLYCGQQCPAEQTPDTDEFRAVSKTLARVSQELHEALSHEQRILLDGYKNAMEECAELIYAEAFRQGFLLGAEFIKEIPEAYRPLREWWSVICYPRHRRWQVHCLCFFSNQEVKAYV